MHSSMGGPGMMGPGQQSFLSFTGNRPSFPQPHNTNTEQFDGNLLNKPLDNMSGMPMNRPAGPGHSNSLQNSHSSENRFSSPRMASGDGLGMPFGPGFPSMFRHPPPQGSGFPPPPNFSTPPPEHGMPGNQNANQGHPMGQRSMGGLNLSFSGSGYLGNNFSQAPGVERPQGGREQQPQTPPQMNFQQVNKS